ncbi:hypothetical protein PoMZ_10645 [Pyricularia oryzae]|uniref:Uncharacterized protein n=1 Tax=Pyricularia oryzae TaxID=318829 RepID=A0A4P7MYD3_PYROR|nr:hypothetical protein PoMZ_10645 [Pyricularia oryzae]
MEEERFSFEIAGNKHVDLRNTDLTAFLGNRGSSYRGFDPASQGPARRDSRSNGTDRTVWEWRVP